LTAPQTFVIPPYPLGELRWDGITIDRHECVWRFSATNLLCKSLAELAQWIGYKRLQLIPVRRFRMTLEFLARATHSVANPRCLAAKLGIVNELFDVSHPVRPLPESLSGDRSFGRVRRSCPLRIRTR
jgi:hypothetical protein